MEIWQHLHCVATLCQGALACHAAGVQGARVHCQLMCGRPQCRPELAQEFVPGPDGAYDATQPTCTMLAAFHAMASA